MHKLLHTELNSFTIVSRRVARMRNESAGAIYEKAGNV